MFETAESYNHRIECLMNKKKSSTLICSEIFLEVRDIRIQLDCHKTKTRASLTTECLSGSLSCYFLVFVEGLSSWSTEIKFLRQ